MELEELDDRLVDNRRSHRRFAVVAGAVVVAAAIAGVALSNLGSHRNDGNRPPATQVTTPTDPTGLHLDEGPPSRVAYIVGHQLRYSVAGRPLSVDLGGELSDLHQVGDIVMVTVNGSSLRVLRLGSPNQDLLQAPTAGSSALSPDGEYAAWLRPGDGRAVVIVSRLAGGQADRFMTFPEAPSCCDNPFNLVGITSDGRLIAWMGSLMKVWAWDFAHDDKAVTQLTGLKGPTSAPGTDSGPVVPVQVVGDRLAVAYDGGGYGIGPISAAGQWHAEGTSGDRTLLSFAQRTLFSPTGERIAFFDEDGLHVYSAGTTTDLLLPVDATQSAWAFEDDDHLLVTTTPDRNSRAVLIRCTLGGTPAGSSSQRCEQVDAVIRDLFLPRP